MDLALALAAGWLGGGLLIAIFTGKLIAFGTSAPARMMLPRRTARRPVRARPRRHTGHAPAAAHEKLQRHA